MWSRGRALFQGTTPSERLGMLYISLSMLMYTVASGFAKVVSFDYPVNEIVFFRALFSLPIVFVLAYQDRYVGGFHIRYVSVQVLLIALSLLGTGCAFASFNHMPFADAVAINYTSPFFAVVAAVWLIKEKPNIWQVLILCVGFLGLLAIVRPTFGYAIGVGVLLALACAVIDGLCTTTGRYFIQKGLHVSSLSFYYSLICLALSTLTLPFFYVPLQGADVPCLAGMGLLTGCGQYFFLKGMAWVPAAVGAPLIYTSMIWSVLIGYWVWEESLPVMTFVGMGLIVVSGITLSMASSNK